MGKYKMLSFGLTREVRVLKKEVKRDGIMINAAVEYERTYWPQVIPRHSSAGSMVSF